MALHSGKQAMTLGCRCIASSRLPFRTYYNPSSQEPAAAPDQKAGPVQVIDIRSDVLTKPTARMKEAMMKSSLGDDVFDEDDCVHELQDKIAEMFGKERALFVPSGTMGNLISVLEHCSFARGLEVLMGDKSHLYLYEQGGISSLGGIHPRTMPNLADGTFDLDLFEESIRPRNDPHQPWTALVTIENTHNNCGGKAITPAFLKKLRQIADEHEVKVHMDGARLMNSVVANKTTPAEMLKDVHTVSMCFSKGVGCPIGSVIAGPSKFIDSAVRLRKVLGGGWRKPGMLAAAAIMSLEDVVPRMERDHANAKRLAKFIKEHGNGVVDVDIDGVHTNIVMVEILKPGLTAVQFCQRLATITDQEEEERGVRVSVLAGELYKRTVRICTYHNVTDQELEAVHAKLAYVLNEYAEASSTSHEAVDSSKTKGEGKHDWYSAENGTKNGSYESLLYDLAYRK